MGLGGSRPGRRAGTNQALCMSSSFECLETHELRLNGVPPAPTGWQTHAPPGHVADTQSASTGPTRPANSSGSCSARLGRRKVRNRRDRLPKALK
jgi:hypothetical protein